MVNKKPKSCTIPGLDKPFHEWPQDFQDYFSDKFRMREIKMFEMRQRGMTFQAIGNEFGVTLERIRQICWKLYVTVEFKLPHHFKKHE